MIYTKDSGFNGTDDGSQQYDLDSDYQFVLNIDADLFLYVSTLSKSKGDGYAFRGYTQTRNSNIKKQVCGVLFGKNNKWTQAIILA
jgi:hypothetical protein